MSRRSFESTEELRTRIEEYFEDIRAFNASITTRGKLPTKGGMTLFLGVSRDTLNEYEDKEGYSDTIKDAYLRIEDGWVQNLTAQSAAGTIFYLKNAFHYRDQKDVNLNDKRLIKDDEGD